MKVWIDIDTLPVVLNEHNLYYWNKMSEDQHRRAVNGLEEHYNVMNRSLCGEHASSLTELNIDCKFLFKEILSQ